MTTIKQLLILVVSIVAVTLLPQKYASVGQDFQFGTVQGVVTREGTAEPLAGVQITVVAKGSLAASGWTAQQVILAINRGAALHQELVQLAQDATRRGPRAALANAAPIIAVSDAAGRFTARNVPVGENFVRAQLLNYFGPANNGTREPVASETVDVSGQQAVEVKLSLVRGGTIAGRVLDPIGKPLQNSSVQVLQSAYENGTPSFQLVSRNRTDDRGEFRAGVLAPGEYYLAASPPIGSEARGALTPAGEVAITTLYPNTTDFAKAQPIVVHEGEDSSGMNIQLRAAQGVKISGRVTQTLPAAPPTDPRGRTRPMLAVLGLAPRDQLAPPALVAAGAGITASADGAFEISNVAPGSYDLFARLPVANGWGGLAPPERAATAFAFGRTSVEVRRGNVEGVKVLVHQGVDVRGRITVAGRPPARNTFRVGLSLDKSATRVGEGQIYSVFDQIAKYAAQIDEAGSFTFPLIPEGHYRPQIAFLGPVADSYLADIRQGAISIFDSGLRVGSESAGRLEIVVNTNGGSIEGRVLTEDRKAVPRTGVVLVPPAIRRQNSDLFKFAQTDAQGHFVIEGVAPGSWKLFAWESVPRGAYQNRDSMQKYEARGTSVTVTARVRANVDTTLIRK